jgi:HK97 family phage portal protein
MFRRAPAAVEAKASAVAHTHVLTPGQPVWSERNYRQFADEAYRKNVIAYQAINRIADAVASVSWVAFRGAQELTTHPVLDLIARPNPRQSGSAYLREKVGYLLISGNGYEERVTVGSTARELYQLRPDRMQIIPSASGEPLAYEYTVSGKRVRFDALPAGGFDLRHLKMFNPTDDWYGLSPVEAGSYSIDQHSEAQAWLVALLQNSARPSGALTLGADATLSDDQFNRLKAQMEAQYSGSMNAGRPMLLEGGLTWEQMGLGPQDMGIIEAKDSASRDIALAFGVPPQMLGIPGDNTYSNYQEARLAFWEDTVIPLVDLIAEDWTAFLGEPAGVEIRADYDQIPAIAEKRATLWTMADSSTDLTINERREMKGYGKIPGGDVLLIAPGSIPIEMAGAAPEAQPAPPEAPTDEQLKAIAYGFGA